MFLARCFLVGDCFSDGSEQVVVQMIDIHIRFSAALRAMTCSEGESGVILFGFFMQLLKLCGAINNFDYSGLRFPYTPFFDHQPAFALRRIEHSLSQQLSDCAAGWWVICLFYNSITPTVYWLVLKVFMDFQSLIPFGNRSKSYYGQSPE